MDSTRALVIAVLWCLLSTGCAATTTTNNPLSLLRGEPHLLSSILSTGNFETPSRDGDCYLDIVLDRSPERPFIVVGEATALWTGTDAVALESTDRVVMDRLTGAACEAGGHVLFRMRSHYQDQWVPRSSSSGVRSRDVFVRTIRSIALVGVYVRRDGSLMPPPSGPRRVIRVPTPLDRTRRDPASSTDEAVDMAWDQGITDPWAVPVD